MIVFQDIPKVGVHYGTGRPIAEVTAKNESIPRRLAALERARAQLADAIVKVSGGRRSLTATRLAAGLSQKQLAERTGMLQPQIACLEAGVIATAGANTIRKLRDALGVSADDILDRANDVEA